MSTDKTEPKGYHRKGDAETGPQGKDKDQLIKEEVRKLIKVGNTDISYSDLAKIREKYKDERFVSEIYDSYHDYLKDIMKEAHKFAKSIIKKYGKAEFPLHKVLQKALKYKKDLELSDSAFNLFRKLYEQKLMGKEGAAMYPRTKIGKTLGATYTSEEKLVVDDKEIGVLQDVLGMYERSKVLHAQAMFQSITYEDMAPESLTGTFNTEKHNPASHVHPVIAALFFQKNRLLDEHMLFANIGYIVKSKHEGVPIMTKPDFELYYDLITDPNDVVCNIDSPMADLRNRFVLQQKIWESVIRLRNGQYYDDSLIDFMVAVDNCRINVYDAPDMMYIRDDGAVLRRILSAFSLRPTVVTTFPIPTLMGATPYEKSSLTQINPIQMVTLRLPLAYIPGTPEIISLQSALSQSQWFLENKALIPKSQTVLYSKEVLFFYINRRYQNINISRYVAPYNFTQLPLTMSGFEKLNDRAVDFEERMRVGDDEFLLRSAVIVESTSISDNNKLITGSTTALMSHRNISKGKFDNLHYLYDPYMSGKAMLDNGSNKFIRQRPVTFLTARPLDSGPSDAADSFYEMVSKRATILVYQKESSIVCDNPYVRV